MEQAWLKQLEKIKPIKKYTVMGVTFLVYKAKNLYDSKWNSGLLKKITKEARKSYLRYGAVPLFDTYDKNAEIYLCRAIDSETEEWLCIRFIPGQTGSSPLEDLEQYVCGSKPLSMVVKEKLLPQVKNFQNKLVGISRICGIAPYAITPEKSKNTPLPSSMKHTGQSFVLINKSFFHKKNFTYLIGVFRKELLKKLLRYDKKTSVYLPNAYELLGCQAHQLHLNRNLLARRFPGYFLNIFQLINLLDKLIKQKKLSPSSIQTFLKPYNPNFKQYLKQKKYVEVLKITAGLSKLLLAQGKIPGSKISSDELRNLVAKYVNDGPDLKIISVDNWKKQLEAITI